jgi:hypothetical protein
MAQQIEISLRVPSLRDRTERSEDKKVIANDGLRFSKRIEVESIPKPGHVLTMTTSSGLDFTCDVVRADWHDDKGAFVVACRYSKRTISPGEYEALVNASDWQVRPLL